MICSFCDTKMQVSEREGIKIRLLPAVRRHLVAARSIGGNPCQIVKSRSQRAEPP